jgi:hypothetical protein
MAVAASPGADRISIWPGSRGMRIGERQGSPPKSGSLFTLYPPRIRTIKAFGLPSRPACSPRSATLRRPDPGKQVAA